MKKAPDLISCKRVYSFFSAIVCLFMLLAPQDSIIAQSYFTAERSYVLKLGTTKPLSESILIGATDQEKLEKQEANKPKVIPNFAGRRRLDFHSPGALPLGPDPLFMKSNTRLSENEILPSLNFEGMNESNSGSQPPDVNGDVGKDFYVEIVNATFFRVFDKTGHPVSNQISANTIWSQVQQSSAGDPILLYDQEVDRWFLTEFPSSNRILIGISHTGDPRSSWDVYTFQTQRFPDFPKYAIWNDSYFMTDNESGSNAPLYAINRHDLLSGLDTVRFQRLTVPKINGVSFEVGQPVDWDGFRAPPENSPGIVVKLNDDDWGKTDHDQIVVYKMNIDWTNASNSHVDVLSIPTAPFDTDGCLNQNTGGFSCVPQPNGQGIDGAEWIITNKAMYRNFGDHESIVLSFMVDVTGGDVAGIRWMEFRKLVDKEWTLYQEGTVGSDDGLHRFMSSIGMDGQGNIGLAYSISGPDKFPSLRYTGRYSSDPLGQMSFKEYEFASGSGSVNTDRFGDYAAMSVDPADDHTFWFSGEYVLANGNWATRIVAFDPGRDSIDIFPTTLRTPENRPELTTNEPLTVCVLNRGLLTIDSFMLAYKFEGGPWIEEPVVIDSFPPDSTYCHTFMTGLDFNAPGNYTISVATKLDLDQNHKNDTISFLINKPAYKDIALEYVVPNTETVLCSSESANTILFRNVGADTITSALLQVFLEDVPIDTVEWTGNLAFGEQSSFLFNIEGMLEGLNHIRITLLEINDTLDQIPSNNEIEWTLNAQPNGQQITINLVTDNFPQETTWELVDDQQHVLATGGPYSEQQHSYSSMLCVDPEMCYTFTVRDAFGDGMSAQGIQGSYQIINQDGGLIASILKPNFGIKESNTFCITAKCLLALEVGVGPTSTPEIADGFVIGNVSNGLGTIMYSLTGGAPFQLSGTFLNISPGTFTMLAVDGAGCRDTVEFIVPACTLETMISAVPATGGDVGEIHISTVGGIGHVLVSLNGGAFVTDTIFKMLEPGSYVVVTRDSIGCERTDSVMVSTMVSTNNISQHYFIQISPNPGSDLFQINGLFGSKTLFINYDVFSSAGEPLFNGSVVKYNEQYKGELSLRAFPPGVYYVAFNTGEDVTVRRIVKLQ
ncbi:MAG: T9SS type A sorting domain-containing protein [Saprospiraceae bacterium]|uniref:T9SS type A sorting domain-containing protein n=1 Tax=Candidatus Opimibacter skivensis TaxID=2982028 RepID=A0A9D7XRJ3_9BACT|nr:T9SS type A sorting domain-containing protein [Candidatus Opimibacter skivensis]